MSGLPSPTSIGGVVNAEPAVQSRSGTTNERFARSVGCFISEWGAGRHRTPASWSGVDARQAYRPGLVRPARCLSVVYKPGGRSPWMVPAAAEDLPSSRPDAVPGGAAPTGNPPPGPWSRTRVGGNAPRAVRSTLPAGSPAMGRARQDTLGIGFVCLSLLDDVVRACSEYGASRSDHRGVGGDR